MLAPSYLGQGHQQHVSLRALLDPSTSENANPEINLDWEPFQGHIEAFLQSIDSYVQRARSEIAGRSTDHTAQVRNLTAEKSEIERRTELEHEREKDMLSTLENERRHMQDLTASLSHLQANLSKVKEQSASLEIELNQVRKEAINRRAEKERQSKSLQEMKVGSAAELDVLEEAMGWKLEGLADHRVLMRFTLIDTAEPAREFSVIMDMSKPGITVSNCSPPLNNLAELVRALNTDKDFGTFIVKLRKSFKNLIPAPDPNSKFDLLSGPNGRTPGRQNMILSSAAAAAANAATPAEAKSKEKDIEVGVERLNIA